MTPLITAMLGDRELPNEVLIDALKDEGVAVAKVYVVQGAAGEYSDRCDWDVAAFLVKESADALCAELNAWVAANPRAKDGACPLDPNFVNDWETNYGVCEVELRG